MVATATTSVSAFPEAVGTLRLNMLPVVFLEEIQTDVVHSLPYSDELSGRQDDRRAGPPLPPPL